MSSPPHRCSPYWVGASDAGHQRLQGSGRTHHRWRPNVARRGPPHAPDRRQYLICERRGRLPVSLLHSVLRHGGMLGGPIRHHRRRPNLEQGPRHIQPQWVPGSAHVREPDGRICSRAARRWRRRGWGRSDDRRRARGPAATFTTVRVGTSTSSITRSPPTGKLHCGRPCSRLASPKGPASKAFSRKRIPSRSSSPRPCRYLAAGRLRSTFQGLSVMSGSKRRRQCLVQGKHVPGPTGRQPSGECRLLVRRQGRIVLCRAVGQVLQEPARRVHLALGQPIHQAVQVLPHAQSRHPR